MKIRIIDYYLGKTVIGTIFLVVLVLLGVEAFIEFTREFSDIGSGYYDLTQVIAYVTMVLPTNIYQLFPMAGLLGCVVGLGLLASHSELIVMRVAGVSISGIALAVLKAALFLSLLMLLVGEVVAPILQHKAAVNKAEAVSGGQALLTQQGVWLREQGNFVHVRTVVSYERMEGITRYSFNLANQLQLLSFASSADYHNGKWVFNDVTQTNLNGNHVAVTHFATQQWGLKLKPRLFDLTSLDTEQKTLPQLWRYIESMKQSGLNAANYEFDFWQRIFRPITTLVMIVLAIPFVFGPLRSSSMGLRMLIGAVIGFAFYIFNQFIGPFSIVYQIPPVFAALLPTLVFAAISALLLRETRV